MKRFPLKYVLFFILFIFIYILILFLKQELPSVQITNHSLGGTEVRSLSHDTFLDIHVALPYIDPTTFNQLTKAQISVAVYLYNPSLQHAYHSIANLAFVYNQASDGYGAFGNRFLPVGNIPTGHYKAFIAIPGYSIKNFGKNTQPFYLRNATTNTLPDIQLSSADRETFVSMAKTTSQHNIDAYCLLSTGIHGFCPYKDFSAISDDGIIDEQHYMFFIQSLIRSKQESILFLFL